MNIRVAAALVHPTIRVIPWGAAFGPIALALPLLMLFRPGQFDPTSKLLVGIRLGAVLVAVGAAFLWDEPARALTDPTPIRLAQRRALRLALYVPAAAAGWMLLLIAAMQLAGTSALPERPGSAGSSSIPMVALSLEATALVVAALAIAAITARRVRGVDGGLVAAPILLLLVGITALLPGRFAMMLPHASDGRWAMVNRRWWWVLCGSAVALALASRDAWASLRLRWR